MPTFFGSAAEFRAWLEAHHETERELLVGYWKVGSGRPSMTWPESVDEALCFGWIDGVRRRIDDKSYTIRFTPRKARSVWSSVNVARVEALTREGRMRPAGLRAFEARAPERSGIYAYEQDEAPAFSPEYEKRFRAKRAAWAFFETQAPSYRRSATHWVMGAKKEETREKRLADLIACSAEGRRLPQYTRPKPS